MKLAEALRKMRDLSKEYCPEETLTYFVIEKECAAFGDQEPALEYKAYVDFTDGDRRTAFQQKAKGSTLTELMLKIEMIFKGGNPGYSEDDDEETEGEVAAAAAETETEEEKVKREAMELEEIDEEREIERVREAMEKEEKSDG